MAMLFLSGEGSRARVMWAPLLVLVIVSIHAKDARAFVPGQKNGLLPQARTAVFRRYANSPSDSGETSDYDSTDASSKGIVSSLTGLVNFFMPSQEETEPGEAEDPPSSPTELQNRIRDDYVVNNYLWTGAIDIASFEKDCRFTDPTLSFVGRDQFVSNVQNLKPIVDALIEPGGCRSELLEISINKDDKYIQSRWNMVGELSRLPWKPKVDVIGRTKFWYRPVENGGFRVYFYDECWELPAGRALLQLITPAGTIPNKE